MTEAERENSVPKTAVQTLHRTERLWSSRRMQKDTVNGGAVSASGERLGDHHGAARRYRQLILRRMRSRTPVQEAENMSPRENNGGAAGLNDIRMTQKWRRMT